jgi:hypothetical protein
MKSRLLALMTFAGLALLIPTATRADLMYTASVAAQSGSVPGAPAAAPSGPASVNVDLGNGNTLRFTANSSVLPIDPTTNFGADINFGNVQFLPSTNVDATQNFDVFYNYTVVVTDELTHATQTTNLTGEIKGGVSGGLVNGVTIASTVTGLGASPDTLTFATPTGDIVVTNKGGTGPGSALIDGVFQANLKGIRAVPEPSSIALVCLGGLGLVAGLRRRRSASKA